MPAKTEFGSGALMQRPNIYIYMHLILSREIFKWEKFGWAFFL